MLALALGKTIAELRSTMPQAEYARWAEFYRLYPFDDLHRYHRPAALVASRQSGKLQEMMDWLAPEPSTASLNDADINTMRAMGFARYQGA